MTPTINPVHWADNGLVLLDQTLRRLRRQLIEDFRATLESYYRMMSSEFGEDTDAKA